MTQEIERTIDDAWETRDQITPATKGPVRDAVGEALDGLDRGTLRVAQKEDARWRVHQWLKKAVLLSFRLNDMSIIGNGPGAARVVGQDPVEIRATGMRRASAQAGFRAVPSAVVRHSAFIAPGVVLMPSFVNVGAYVDSGTMIDTWATVGCCAQIGKNCHISGGAGIGGVLEPVQAEPVIIEDDCFIGARSEVAEGVIVERGSVLAMGVFLGASTQIIDRETGETHQGRVPAYSVVVPGVSRASPCPTAAPARASIAPSS